MSEYRRYQIDRVRNIGLMAHIDAGKTTTTERILYYTGKTHKLGEVHEGSTEMDWMPQERERGITITSAATTCYWRDHQINIIDTPGHVDFTAEVERSLRVLDGVIAIFSGVEMVESQSEKVWRQADKYNVPRIAFVNKLDRIGAQFEGTIEMMAERLGATPIPVQIPLRSDDELGGMIDLVKMKLIHWDPQTKGKHYQQMEIPEVYRDRAVRFRERMLERLAEIDDELLANYIEERPIEAAKIQRAIRIGCIEHGYVPVFGGSALKNIGIQPLIDAIVDYLPAPTDLPPIQGTDPQTSKNGQRDVEKKVRRADPDEPFAALVFKVVTDEYTGRLIFIRIYSGRIEPGDFVLNSTTGKRTRIARIFHMHANKRTSIDSASAGDIVAIIGPNEVTTGDTLCDPGDSIVLEKIEFPEPVMSVAIEPKTEAQEILLSEALYKLTQEDPTFTVGVDPNTNQMIISGMGELHLEVLIRRLIEDFGVSANVGRPAVAYRETLIEPVDVEERFVKQTGGRGQFAHIQVRFEPLERGAGFRFESQIKGGIIPKEYIPAVQLGIKEAMSSGSLAGYPVVDIVAIVYGGSFHPVDSSELAFKIAGSRALRAVFEQGPHKYKLLEPIMEGEIICPSEYLGEVINDINARRGDVVEIEGRGDTQIIMMQVPLAETFGYATQLRSLTQGRASYMLRFFRYELVPETLTEEILMARVGGR
ncbi:MAG: elongation factor G [Candidatus Bipolaricaulia bacterium]